MPIIFKLIRIFKKKSIPDCLFKIKLLIKKMINQFKIYFHLKQAIKYVIILDIIVIMKYLIKNLNKYLKKF